jgi:hypothetical protein
MHSIRKAGLAATLQALADGVLRQALLKMGANPRY